MFSFFRPTETSPATLAEQLLERVGNDDKDAAFQLRDLAKSDAKVLQLLASLLPLDLASSRPHQDGSFVVHFMGVQATPLLLVQPLTLFLLSLSSLYGRGGASNSAGDPRGCH